MRNVGLFCLALLFATGCSRLKMAYDLGPWYMEKEARDALPDLTKEQSQRLKQEIQIYARWHRREMLPAYAEALHILADGLTATAGARTQRLAGPLLSGLWAQTLEPLFRPGAVLLCSLSPQQIQAFRLKLEARTEKQRQLYLVDPEKAFQRRLAKIRGYIEDYSSKLSPDQAAKLESLSRAFVIPYEAWINNKARRQQELLRLLSEKRGPAAVQAHLRDWWLSPRSGGTWREDWQWDEKAEADYTREVLNLLYPIQRQRLATKLTAMAAELEGILPEPGLTPRPGPTAQPVLPH
jgi:hypothetical protein